jgi:hypothetical protein
MFTQDPIITKKIHFIKGILKEFTSSSKQNKKAYVHNRRIYSKYPGLFVIPDDAKAQLKPIVEMPFDFDENDITILHIYYLKVKNVNKQHTKDDKKYEGYYAYQKVTSTVEKEFQLLQEAGKEGNYVTSN